MKLIDRVGIVTGAGRGIGRTIALKFAEEGAIVAVIDIEHASIKSLAQRIISKGGQAIAIQGDVRDQTTVKRMFNEVANKFSHIDILVNNAGIRKDILFHEMSLKDWDSVVDTLLKGGFNCTNAVHKYMMAQNYGKVLNIASPIPSYIARKGQVNYATANAGIEGFTKSLSIELGIYGINVNCIAPDFIDTEMIRSAARRDGMYLDDLKRFIAAAIPMRRLGTPDEVAKLALFLVTDESSFITGQVIHIKGGP